MLKERRPRAGPLLLGLLVVLAAGTATAGHESGHMDAEFQPKAGNEWWVETDVTADEPLAGVDARADGGAWVALEKQDWGSWAKSFHVPDGSVVEFRATSTDGDTVVSDGYVWPGAEPVDGDEPPDTTDAAFGPKAGNEWWVETLVVAEDPVTRVEARADGGPWHDLSLRDWGAWAGSFHAPDGIVVQFRATTDAGTDTSHGFTWSDATVVGSDGSWPEEGSYLRSETRSSSPGPVTSQGHSTAVWHDGQWWVHSHREGEDPGGPFEDESFCTGSHIPGGPTDVAVGDRVDVQVGTCHEGYFDVFVRERTPYDTHRDGDPVTLDAWSGDRTDPCLCLRWEAEWDVETGLLLHTERAGRSSHVTDLVDTDAPVG